MVKNIIQYVVSLKEGAEKIDTPNINTYAPSPSDSDYKVGYIIRYFTQKTNDKDSPIFEINEYIVSSIESNPMYIVKFIRWRITGKPQEIMDSNKKSIETVYEFLPKLKLYLPNLLQFAKVN